MALGTKLAAAGWRLRDLARTWPLRLRRLTRHVQDGVSLRWGHSVPGFPRGKLHHVAFWWIELVFLLLDLPGVPEIFETIADFVKWRTRPLTDGEIALARPIFGERINWKRVRIDERALLGPPQFRLCYVSFYTINSWRSMPEPLFIHELTHIWQYEQLGSVYIPRALAAQWTQEGYDFGGRDNLVAARKKGKKLSDFNLEQQADIIAGYYLEPGRRTDPEAMAAYRYFAAQIRSGNAE